MDILDPAVHQTSRDQDALPSPVSGSAIAPNMRHHSEHKLPWSECMKIAVNTTGHFDSCMALATIPPALLTFICLPSQKGCPLYSEVEEGG